MAEGNSPKDIRKEVNPGGSSDEYSIFGANVPGFGFIIIVTSTCYVAKFISIRS